MIIYSVKNNVDDNMKQIYNMVDGIPIWQHLKNGTDENKIRLIASDFGRFAEILGRRVLNNLTEKGGILGDIFPGINIINVQRPSRMRIIPNAKIEIGDLILEIDYKDDIKFGKKIVVFAKLNMEGSKLNKIKLGGILPWLIVLENIFQKLMS